MAMKVRFDASAPYEVDEMDVTFARPEGKELQARVYRPKGEPESLLAALIDVHGGAWSRNDRTSGAHHGRALAASGLLVVSVDFRQGPDHKHPAGSADVAAGIRWVRAHAARLGVDPARVGIVGATRLVNAHHGYFANEAAMHAASVTPIVTARETRALPPVWLAQPELDDNVPTAIPEAFVQAYHAAGGALERVHFPDAKHGFVQQPSADSDKAIALMREFIARQLSGAVR
jgi:acetyl esterase/lipase